MRSEQTGDRISLEGMRFYGYHGCLPEERARGQAVRAAEARQERAQGPEVQPGHAQEQERVLAARRCPEWR